MTKLFQRIMNFEDIIAAQDVLNELTVPKWKTTMTPSKYVLQAIVEMVELVTESGVKHKWWKHHENAQVDDWNVKIEVIDMIHFIISAHILTIRKKLTEENAETCKKVNEQLSTIGKDMFIGIDVLKLAGTHINDDMRMISEDGWINYDNAVDVVMNLSLFTQDNNLTYLDVYRLSYANLILLAASVGLTSLEISAIYTAKMTLNQIRQSNGYKDGTYVKVKDGLEDNQRLKVLVSEFVQDESMTLNKLAKNVRSAFFVSNI